MAGRYNNYRLVIKEPLPDVWYKDEGGRDKCMLLNLQLLGESKKVAESVKVPLRITLVYEDGIAVSKQDILKMSPETVLVLEKGKAVLKLRIEDVSKNHQGQSFRIRVDPDSKKNAALASIKHALSTAVSIRSKRNKRNRAKLAGLSPDADYARRVSGEQESPVHSVDGGQRQPFDTSPPAGSYEQRLLSSVSLNEPMNGIITWAGSVINGLHKIEWELVGYEVDDAGKSDQTRPLYRCPSCRRYKDSTSMDTAEHAPKCALANILLVYAKETMFHLQTMLTAVEAHSSSTAPATSSESSNNPVTQSQSNAEALSAGKRPNLTNGTDVSSLLGQSTSGTSTISLASSTDFDSHSHSHGQTLLKNNNNNNNNSSSSDNNNAVCPTHAHSPSLAHTHPTSNDSTNRLNFGGGTGSGPASSAGLSVFGSLSVTSEDEAQVEFVLARLYVNRDMGGAIGFPCFNSAQALIGFYQEMKGQSSNELFFIPLSLLPQITEGEVAAINKLLRDEYSKGIDCVHKLSQYGNDTKKLKEQVLLYHWSKTMLNELNTQSLMQ